MKKAIIAMMFAIAFISCGRKTEQCEFEGFKIKFIGYDSSEVDSLMIYRYTTGGDFNNLIDSSLLVYGIIGGRVDDSTIEYAGLNWYEVKNSSNHVVEKCDFKLKNLANQQMVSIKDIQYKINTRTHGVFANEGTNPCTSPVSSFMQDGILQPNKSFCIIHK